MKFQAHNIHCLDVFFAVIIHETCNFGLFMVLNYISISTLYYVMTLSFALDVFVFLSCPFNRTGRNLLNFFYLPMIINVGIKLLNPIFL